MSNLMRPPKPHLDNVAKIADFAEIECLLRGDGSVSRLDIARIVQRRGDHAIDAAATDDDVSRSVAEAFDELETRSRHCGPDDGRYPFVVRDKGKVLCLRDDRSDNAPPPTTYFYLLLATRMNMQSERRQADEDATVLFEQFCREVAVRYWGGPADSIGAIVFGTGRLTEDLDDGDELNRNSFVNAVNHLTKELKEGHKFEADPNSQVRAKDGKLDIVVWRRFADERQGQLIGFGQCKTGTHWADDLIKLRPDDFFTKWVYKRAAVLPVRMYFVTDRVTTQWFERCVDGGILFDRCRIMEYASDLPTELNDRMAKWVRRAANSKGLALP